MILKPKFGQHFEAELWSVEIFKCFLVSHISLEYQNLYWLTWPRSFKNCVMYFISPRSKFVDLIEVRGWIYKQQKWVFAKLCPGLQSKIKRKKVLPSGHVVIVVPGIVTVVVILFFIFSIYLYLLFIYLSVRRRCQVGML